MTTQKTLAEFITENGIKMSSVQTDRNPHMDGSEKMDNWKCLLTRGGRQMTVHFSKGIGHHGAEPTAEEVLNCLAMDSSSVEQAGSFEDWCSDFGYNTDSRKAEKTFNVCVRHMEKLQTFLGEAYAELVLEVERL